MAFKTAELETLVELADRLDSEGKTQEAMTVDAAIHTLIKAAEAEEADEKGARSMSGKAKAKFRAVKKSCESLCKSDLDYRGPHKKECRKVETLCEEILEALKECDFE